MQSLQPGSPTEGDVSSLPSFAVRGARLPVDGAAEVRRELQPSPCPDGETRCPLCQLPQDRSAHGLPQRVLRPPAPAGEDEACSRELGQHLSFPDTAGSLLVVSVLPRYGDCSKE